MHLLIVHAHWRPGGVRQVVTSALGSLAADPRVELRQIVMAAGEPAPPEWAQAVESLAGPNQRVTWVVEPWFGYASGWPGGPAPRHQELRNAATRLLKTLPVPCTVLLENPAVGRNPLIGRAFAEACAATGSRLVCHHHDFFPDGRWDRWSDIQSCGLTSLETALASALPEGPDVTHLTVNARDALWLGRCRPTHFCPNPAPTPVPPDAAKVAQARLWLRASAATEAPVWLCPTRVLRRKNIAEAVMLAHLLAPDAVVATTGDVSSPAEARYAQALANEPGTPGPALRLGLLAAAEKAQRPAPGMASLMAASERVVVPSLFEGFGLPVLEAGALGRPCLARRAACPGGQLPDSVEVYDDLWVPWDMAGGLVERGRQRTAWRRWTAHMPSGAAAQLPQPWWWSDGLLTPFSRLTLQGQLQCWRHCRSHDVRDTILELNPALRSTTPTAAVRSSSKQLAGPVEITLANILSHPGLPTPVVPDQDQLLLLLENRLGWANHYPLLWPESDDTLPPPS